MDEQRERGRKEKSEEGDKLSEEGDKWRRWEVEESDKEITYK